MKKVELEEIIGLERYQSIRDEFRRSIIDYKKCRRLHIGDQVTLVFENHATMFFQVQEMLRAERITDLDRIRDELEVYNALIPDDDELSATLLIEITESDNIRRDLIKLIGIDESVTLRVGGHQVSADFEPGRSKEDKLSAVQYLRFVFDASAKEAFLASTEPVSVEIDHANYRFEGRIGPELHESLCKDLRGEVEEVINAGA